MEMTPEQSPNLGSVISESKRIIGASYCQFLALSLLFIPLSLSLITIPIFQLPSELFTIDHFHKFPRNHLLYTLVIYVLSLCAITTITYSTYHAFSGKPVKFFVALNSLTVYFFPIVSTAIIAHVLLFLISLSFLLFVGTSLMMIQHLGFVVIDYNSSCFMWFSFLVGATLSVIIIYFQVNWSLAFVVVVAESNWGFAALTRSSYLVKGMRSVSLVLLLYFGFYCGITIWTISGSLQAFSTWGYILYAKMLGSSMLMLYMLYITTANAVLYNYCKAFHGELELSGFTNNHIKLPCDDDKAPHVTIVVTA